MISRDNADAAAERRNGRSRLTCDSASAGKVQRDHEGGS